MYDGKTFRPLRRCDAAGSVCPSAWLLIDLRATAFHAHSATFSPDGFSMTRPSSFDYEQLRACGRGELFGDDNARLPSPPMLMFDRITRISEEGGSHGKGLIHAELDIRPDLWFFDCHFIGDPVMPGCLGLDAMWQLSGFFLPWLGEPGRGRALGVGNVKFSGQ